MRTRQMPATELVEIGTYILERYGSSHAESVMVSESLVNSNLRGYDSHGVVRLPEYVANIQSGAVRPGAEFQILTETPAMALVDAHWGWGQVSGKRAMELAIKKANEMGIGAVSVANSQHVGRLGEYPTMAVPHRMMGLALINNGGTIAAEKVAPWGGVEPRLAPNPIAWASPSGHSWPIVVDITTSVIPEGRVRLASFANSKLPSGCILDGKGNPTTDAKSFYGPPQGALLPLGGIVGNKGFGLGIMTEILGGALSNNACVGQRVEQGSSGLFFQAIDIQRFASFEDFIDRILGFEKWIKSSKKLDGFEDIYMPGERAQREYEQRMQTGIPIDEKVWEMIDRLAHLSQ
jgi:hydroxycarboxylate dehydrogenase B